MSARLGSATGRLNLRPGPTLDDGAMGTQIGALLGPDCLPEEANLEHPKFVTEVHRRYLRRGSGIINANTYGANVHTVQSYWQRRMRNGQAPPFGFADLARRMSREGVELARLARRGYADTLIGGCVGPLTSLVRPSGEDRPTGRHEMQQALRPQLEGLLEGGVDFLRLETQRDTGEIEAAIDLWRQLGAEQPIVVTLAPARDAQLTLDDGTDLPYLLRHLERLGVAGLGFNCVRGPAGLIGLAELLLGALESSKLPVFLKPNCGVRTVSEGAIDHAEVSRFHDDFVDLVRVLQRDGANLRPYVVGGCCGTRPSHLRLIKRAVERVQCEPAATKLPYRRPVRGGAAQESSVSARIRVLCAIGDPRDTNDGPTLRASIDQIEANLAGLSQRGYETGVVLTGNPAAPAGGCAGLTALAYFSEHGRLVNRAPLFSHHDCDELGRHGVSGHLAAFRAIGIGSHIFTVGPLASASRKSGHPPLEAGVPFLHIRELLSQAGTLGQIGAGIEPKTRPEAVRDRFELLRRAGAEFVVAQPDQGRDNIDLIVRRAQGVLPIVATVAGPSSKYDASAIELLSVGVGGLLLAPSWDGDGAADYSRVVTALEAIDAWAAESARLERAA